MKVMGIINGKLHFIPLNVRDNGVKSGFINKQGSGVRRLILLNFFRAEAEILRTTHQGNQLTLAFEEPETFQHPDHQEMLIQAFLDLSNTGNSQILLTTHTLALAGMLPLESLRFIEKMAQTEMFIDFMSLAE